MVSLQSSKTLNKTIVHQKLHGKALLLEATCTLLTGNRKMEQDLIWKIPPCWLDSIMPDGGLQAAGQKHCWQYYLAVNTEGHTNDWEEVVVISLLIRALPASDPLFPEFKSQIAIYTSASVSHSCSQSTK